MRIRTSDFARTHNAIECWDYQTVFSARARAHYRVRMKLFPLFADLAGRTVLVVGGGEIAARKTAALLKANAHVRVGARQLMSDALSALRDRKAIDVIEGEFEESWIHGAWLVVAAVDDVAVNRRIAAAAEVQRCFVNVVDDATLSTFHVPAIVDRSPLIVAISSGGAAPMLARRVRERLEIFLDHTIGKLAALLDVKRAAIRARHRDIETRRRFYDRVIDCRVVQWLRAGNATAAEIDANKDGPNVDGNWTAQVSGRTHLERLKVGRMKSWRVGQGYC